MGKNEKKAARAWRHMFPVLVTALAWLLFHQVFFAGYVPTESMEPTIPKGSCILAERMGIDYQRGDVIVFKKEGTAMLKRIFAVGGDRVEIRGDGTVLLGENGSSDGKGCPEGEVLIVPEDCFFVMGDNRENSRDSRYWKERFIKRKDVIGKVLFCRRGWI